MGHIRRTIMLKNLLRKLDGELDAPTDIEIAWEAFMEAINAK
tara:strand:- start:26774 stop:26899 length:126 start_codon:yes stop_codon:yes gene_type:complete